MTLHSVDVESLPEGEAEALAAILTELQGLKVSVAAGALDAHDITITNIATDDTLVAVLRFHTGVPSSLLGEASITSAGHIQCSTTDTSGDVLIVVWFDKS